MTSAICSEKAEWEKKRAEQQTILDNREKELSERSEEPAIAEQLVNEQAEGNATSAERNLAIAAQLEQASTEIEEERRELMNKKNSPHEYYSEIIFEKNIELNSKEAKIADLCNTISEKNDKIANLDALLDEKESKIQTLSCRIVSNENAHEQRLSAALEQQKPILTEKHEKEVLELNEKIFSLENALKALTDKFNKAIAFIKELCMSAATLIYAKNECRADLTKPQRNVIDAICNAGSALCRKFGKPDLAEEIDTKYGLGDSIAEEYDRLTEKDKSRSRSNDGPCL